MDSFVIELILSLISAVFVVLWWLLRQKDAHQAKQIEKQESSINLLFQKHDDDVRKLSELELKIASSHYIKPELDAKFLSLENSIKDGLHTLGTKFDRLTEALINYNTKKM